MWRERRVGPSNEGRSVKHDNAKAGPGAGLLGTVLDALPLALRLFERGGPTLHESTALTRLIESSRRDGACLEAALDALQQADVSHSDPPFLISDGRYEITTLSIEAPLGTDRGELAALLVRPTAHPAIEPTLIAERFRLTPRQVQVALLLARGLRNDAIANSLSVTAHTARRHTEVVFARLGVTARAEVAAIIANLVETHGNEGLVK